MRTITIWRFITCLFLIAGMLAAPDIPVTHPFGGGVSAVAADNGKPGKDNGNKQEDKAIKEQEKEDRRTKNASSPVEPDAGYGVNVGCTLIADTTRTECTFTAVTPAGGKTPSDLMIPEGAVCASVISGDFSAVAVDPTTHFTGYWPRPLSPDPRRPGHAQWLDHLLDRGGE